MKGILDKVVIVISCLALAASFVYTDLAKTNGSQVIRIGSMDFTEQEILNYMLKYYIEDHTDIEVEQSLSLGSSSIVLDALRTGSIDMYVEYTGTIYGNVLGNEPNGNVDEVYNTVKEQMKEQYDLNVLDSLGFNNTYTLAIRKDTAEQYHIKTISDLCKVSRQLTFSPTLMFMEREDCWVGLQKAYPIHFKQTVPIDGAPRYTALMNNECDVIDAYSTDGLLKKFDLQVLEDDKNFFPPYYMLPFVNGKTNAEYPEIAQALSVLNSAIDDATMQKLNYEVVEKGRDRAEVARTFLLERGLVKPEDFKN